MSEKPVQFGGMIARHPQMLQIFETIRKVAKFDTTVLITGESGTGKELVARAIHDHSNRSKKPFVAINCGSIPENLIESELFGHKKGAFTDAVRDKKGLFEEANGGTIFLDEIGDLPLLLQVKLLRVLQEQQIRRVGDEQAISIDVRIVAATLRDLESAIKEGNFRDDLYYRLHVVSIHIPPLRERRQDIPILIQYFIEKHCKKLHTPIRDLSSEALELLLCYPWKGNIRELENCVERMVVLSDGHTITPTALPLGVRNSAFDIFEEDLPENVENLSIKQRTRALEQNLIIRALKKTNGNRTHAAKILEISHRALLYKIKEYGLENLY